MEWNPNLKRIKKELAKKRKTLLLAVKIAVGSSAAIYIAQLLGLEYAISAGTITLLTLLTTKWETVRLSAFRFVTFAVTILLAWASFAHIKSMWIGYGVFIFCVVLFAEMLGWRATISVNSVIGAHLLTSRDFGMAFVENEFLLVLIGVVIAFLLNLFQNNDRNEKDIIANMRYTEERLQQILRRFAQYLSQEEIPGAEDRGENMRAAGSALQAEQEQDAADSGSRGKIRQGSPMPSGNLWDDIIRLEKELQDFILEAYEYQENTFHSHPVYYIDYFEMRSDQCHVLHNLHYEVKKIRYIPKQAGVVAEYMLYLADYVVERNVPSAQMEKLEGIFRDMKKEELPKSREEFENRAILYHILMDMEEFLVYKQRFVRSLDERQKKLYWEEK
ncbi:aromatic acid exporter family protein [Lachnospiraceae bacterium 29-91]